MNTEQRVLVIIGSESDKGAIRPCLDILTKLKIPWALSVLSCHRHERELYEYLQKVIEKDEVSVIIAAAGMAAYLPGYIASHLKGEKIIVIGVALIAQDSDGMDALLSIVRLPSGVPLVCAGLGRAAVINAALNAAKILAISEADVLKNLREFFLAQAEEKPSQIDIELWPRKEEKK